MHKVLLVTFSIIILQGCLQHYDANGDLDEDMKRLFKDQILSINGGEYRYCGFISSYPHPESNKKMEDNYFRAQKCVNWSHERNEAFIVVNQRGDYHTYAVHIFISNNSGDLFELLYQDVDLEGWSTFKNKCNTIEFEYSEDFKGLICT